MVMSETKKSAVGNLGLSGNIRVYPSSRSMGATANKTASLPATKSPAPAKPAKESK